MWTNKPTVSSLDAESAAKRAAAQTENACTQLWISVIDFFFLGWRSEGVTNSSWPLGAIAIISSEAWSPIRRLARPTNSHPCILSSILVDIGGIPSAITDEEILGLSGEGSLIQLPRSLSDGRVGVDLIRVGVCR